MSVASAVDVIRRIRGQRVFVVRTLQDLWWIAIEGLGRTLQKNENVDARGRRGDGFIETKEGRRGKENECKRGGQR